MRASGTAVEVDVFITGLSADAMDVSRWGTGEYIAGRRFISGRIMGGEYHGKLVERPMFEHEYNAQLLGTVQRWTITVHRETSEHVRITAGES